MSRSIVLGLVGDSGTGKTTLTRGLVRVLGEDARQPLSGDDYHRYDRARRVELGVTPLNPGANHLDILAQHLTHLRRWEPVLKPVYDHGRGGFAPATYLRPARFLIAEGLLNFHTETLRSAHEIRVFLAPQEDLHRAWKVKRDCTRRGYTTSEALAEIDRRQDDARAYILPQRDHADIVVAFRREGGDGPAHLDVDVILRDTLPHPDLSPLIDGRSGGPTLLEREHERLLRIPGDLDPEHAAALEEAVWERISFANHLRIRRLGEFTVGTDLRRSDSLALVQLILLYHLVRARATINTGDEPPRAAPASDTGADSALHH